MKSALALIPSVLLICTLGGCGQKGPLYLPEKPTTQAPAAAQKNQPPVDSPIPTSN